MFQITLPHSHCINNDESSHFDGICDIHSKTIGIKLQKVISEKKRAPCLIIQSAQNRSQIDDNREHSKDSPLHRTVIKNLDKTLAILDVHSFYKNAFRLLPQTELDGDPNESYLVLFSLYENDVNERLYRFLKRKRGHENLALIRSPDIVFILKYYTFEMNVPTFMLEFSEFMDVPDKLLDDIADFLDIHFIQMYNYNKISGKKI
jgi:hypothetical protein